MNMRRTDKQTKSKVKCKKNYRTQQKSASITKSKINREVRGKEQQRGRERERVKYI